MSIYSNSLSLITYLHFTRPASLLIVALNVMLWPYLIYPAIISYQKFRSLNRSEGIPLVADLPSPSGSSLNSINMPQFNFMKSI